MTNQPDLDAISKELATRSSQELAGGVIIPMLLGLAQGIVPNLNFKICFWGLFASVLLLWPFGAVLVFFAGAFAVAASYKAPARASGIPLATTGPDVLLGKTIQASTEVPGLHANNNVSITTYKDQYVLAYRQSDHHFPSAKTRLILVSSTDLKTWTEEWTYATGSDLREMLLFELQGRLNLYFFSLVPKGNNFIPVHVYRTVSDDVKTWQDPAQVCRKGEVPWEIKVVGSGSEKIAYKASYIGDHYGSGDVFVLFEQSRDGLTWKPAGECGSVVYKGGICEVAFEFTSAGDLVAVGRNEDGDASGFGTQLFFASSQDLSSWTALKVSIPWRFDSPRMMRSAEGELLLFARYHSEKYQLAPSWVPFEYQKVINLVSYSFLSKTAAVYRIAPHSEWGLEGKGAVQLIRYLERTFSDTGFFSLAREIGTSDSSDRWIVANYTSHTVHSHAPWFIGQMRDTSVFVSRCRIVGTGTA